MSRGLVIVGMSGGVDSAVAAHALKAEGYDVAGMSLLMFEARGRACPGSCCSRESMADAAESARLSGVPHRVEDVRDRFVSLVIEPFARAYARGETPNPCILCNEHVKFPALMREAHAEGAAFIATGHYARVARVPGGRASLLSGIDPVKDQAYVLYSIGADTLDRLLLPLGAQAKDATRQTARRLALPVFKRPESQEICFVGDGQYAEAVLALLPEAARPGPVLDASGKLVGKHKGLIHYTVGQRRGLGIATGEPAYVTRLDTSTNTLHIGPREAVMHRHVRVRDVRWLADVRTAPFRASAMLRSTMRPAPCVATPTHEGRMEIAFEEPQFGPAPGQAAVVFERERVICGGVIG